MQKINAYLRENNYQDYWMDITGKGIKYLTIINSGNINLREKGYF